MKISDDDAALCNKDSDLGEKLVWIPIEDIEGLDIKPPFIKERIRDILETKEVIHIIEERER